jgi:hypothetical protein
VGDVLASLEKGEHQHARSLNANAKIDLLRSQTVDTIYVFKLGEHFRSTLV